MAVGALAQSILTFVAIVLVGVVLRLAGLVERQDAKPLNTVIIYVGLPAFVFTAVHGRHVTPSMFSVVGVAWAVFAACLAVAFLAARALQLDRPRAGGFMLAASLGNTGYIGYPLTAALLGASAVPTAVFYDVFGTVLALVLVGFPIARAFGRQDGARRRLGVLGELLTFPALVAALVALLMQPVSVPIPVRDGLELLASMVAPLIMLSVGISLRPRAIANGAVALVALVAIRLVLGPAVASLVGSFGLAPEAYRVAVLEAGMPSMMLTLAVGERFGLDDDFIAAGIFVTTALAALTVPLAQLIAG